MGRLRLTKNGLAVAFAVLGLLGFTSSASALIITGGPTYTLPGGGTCTVGGITTNSTGTMTCSSIVKGIHTNIYYGIKNDVSVNGDHMRASNPAAAQRFTNTSGSGSTITYANTTNVFGYTCNGTTNNTLTLTRTGGAATVVATGGTPANSGTNGDIAYLYRLDSGTSLTFTVNVTATGCGSGTSNAVFDAARSHEGVGNYSRVDLAFYYSDCGDGVLDNTGPTPESCDAGAANGTAASCCSATCTFKTAGTVCDDSEFCDGANTCTGGSGTCPAAGAGNPCPGADGDANCTETCNETLDNCTANDPNGSACLGNGSGECSGADTCLSGVCQNNNAPNGTQCTDSSPASSGNCLDAQCNAGACNQSAANESNGLSCNNGSFCDGTETCNTGVCGGSTGNPCPGPDGDGNCAESCNEGADNCTLADTNGSACTNGTFCDGTETCTTGTCGSSTGNPCPGPDGDNNCVESCNEASDNCTANDTNGSACSNGTFCDGTETCTTGTCGSSTGNPCPGADGDGNCAETCNEGADNCTANDTDGSLCTNGSFCDGTESCTSGSCGSSTGNPCPGPDGDNNCTESCNEGADNCTANDTNGSACTNGSFCDGTETCTTGTCGSSTGNPCPGADGDGNCAESCDEGADNCTLADTDGSVCTDSQFCNGTDTCASGACSTHTGDPCPGADGDADCSEVCNEMADNCTANDPNGSACLGNGANECSGADTCSSGSCLNNDVAAATPCTDSSPTTGGNCKDAQCNGTGSCDQNFADETNGTTCVDPLFCNGTDSCTGGTCTTHAGNPCPGADGDANCAESCDETADNCNLNDPNGSACAGNGAGECSGADTCQTGACQNNDVASGTSCTDTAPTGSGNCLDAQCNGTGTCDQAFANEANGTGCNDSLYCNGTDMCASGSCSTHSGDPCSSGSDCANICNETADNCIDPYGTACTSDGNDCTNDICDGLGACDPENWPSGTACGDPSDIDCSDPDTCNGLGTCLANHESSGFPCGDTQSCTGITRTNADTCDAFGACQDNGQFSCAPFSCGGNDCLSGCMDDSDCLSGATCFSNFCYEPAQCEPFPVNGCKVSVAEKGGSLKVKVPASNASKKQIKAKMKKMEATTGMELGSPFSGPTTYAFCIYDGNNSLIYNGTIPYGEDCGLFPCWRSSTSSSGAKYKDKTLAQEGIKTIKLKAAAQGKSSVKLGASNQLLTLNDGMGGGLLIEPPYTLPVTVQMLNSPEGTCWESVIDDPNVKKNVPGLFNGSSIIVP